MIVRAAADAFEKPMINIFQNLGTISFSRTVRHCSVMMGCNFQKYILASLGFLNVSGKRHKREVCVPADSGHKRWSGLLRTIYINVWQGGQMVGLIVSVWDGKRDWTTSWSKCLGQAALLSHRSCPLGKGLKFYTSPFSKTLLYTNASKWILIK